MKAPSERTGPSSKGSDDYASSSDFFFRGFLTGSVEITVLGVFGVSSTCVSSTVSGASGNPARS